MKIEFSLVCLGFHVKKEYFFLWFHFYSSSLKNKQKFTHKNTVTQVNQVNNAGILRNWIVDREALKLIVIY